MRLHYEHKFVNAGRAIFAVSLENSMNAINTMRQQSAELGNVQCIWLPLCFKQLRLTFRKI
jgi:hypothetical protein